MQNAQASHVMWKQRSCEVVYSLQNRLVIGIASSALFDLAESDAVFRKDGEEAYRTYQKDHLPVPLGKGIAFSFIQRLLSLNTIYDQLAEHTGQPQEYSSKGNPAIEVVLISRNDPDTGLRVFRSIEHYDLNISRAIFSQGRSPMKYVRPLHCNLFLSANEADVREATRAGLSAGQVVGVPAADEDTGTELRIAFDFDGVLASDEADLVAEKHGLDGFHSYEKEHATIPLPEGPLQPFLKHMSRIQHAEEKMRLLDANYVPKLRISIVTARNAPAHERVLTTLANWDILVNEAFFLGGVDKALILQELRPHIFFDDDQKNLVNASRTSPAVHVPFGQKNLQKGEGKRAKA
jgi:5'-nucleotidase